MDAARTIMTDPDDTAAKPADAAVPPAPKASDEAARVTPMMEQYIEIKAANPDCLLFYRMGDFYEMFFGDAEIASRALGIMLTKRGKHLGEDIPMCGVPVERADEYLHRLIAQGHRVAVCEQLEDPAEARKRGSKSVVRRNVVRLVTAGTLTEDTLLDATRNNYLLAIARSRASSGDDRFALAWIDISTGEFRVAECDRASVGAEIARIEPGELIVSDALYGDAELAPILRALPAVMPLTRDVFDGATAERRLAAFFGVATTASFGAFSRIELTAAAAAVTYIERTQLGKRPPLSVPAREAAGATLAIDQATRGNLELIRTIAGERRGSLLAAIDRTLTSAGARLLGATACSAAHRSGRDRAPARHCRRFRRRQRRALRFARAAQGGARSRPRAGADRRRPRRAARPRRDPRRHPGRGGIRCAGSKRWPISRATSAKPSRRCAGPTPQSPPNLPMRSPTNCRRCAATAASCVRTICRRSTRRARCATNPAASSPRCR